jgi:hypothetical protein
MITLTLVAISLTIGLIIQYAHGQTLPLQDQKESFETLINYCAEHADRPNPIKDLVDKGLLSANFTGQTCMSVIQTYDIITKNLQIQQDKQEKQVLDKEKANAQFLACARGTDATYEECNRLRESIK